MNQKRSLKRPVRRSTTVGLIGTCLLNALAASTFAQQAAGDFDPARWDLTQAKIEEHLQVGFHGSAAGGQIVAHHEAVGTGQEHPAL